MQVWLHSFWVAMVLIGCMWGMYEIGEKQIGNMNTKKAALETPIISTQASHKLVDRDAVVEAFDWTDDKGVGLEYNEAELLQMQKDPDNHNYKKVLRRFVQSELKTEIESFQTIGSQLNPRRILVATTEGMLYEVTMKKRSNHGQIWTIEGYNMTAGYRTDVEQKQDLLPEDMYPTYRVMELAEADLQIQAWAKPLIQNSQGHTFNTALNGKTYLLIKTSQSETDSVEVEGIRIWVEEMLVHYQTYEFGEGADRSILNNYLLIEVPETAESGVTFYNTVTVVR
ncbi:MULTISPECIES: hypothetical protein [Brevibacillus]|uniref:hypothetical protein n=1 Tax=Brevibacillus TaxID=55080 RepID=UPI000D10F374|nr:MULTISPECIES: hypothetical protein [Brevibacillus]MED1948574.1 hypothetical protein [Brevibacillus formosus]MED2001705.1 hypothetical protein [Brevibacillus formosus]MED2085323.1 hypothetical protein [Brevibacillus formosus]PSK12706.1 hypothetical protein C7R94_24220 [Brevibacillus sp. NRRL NRS-603]